LGLRGKVYPSRFDRKFQRAFFIMKDSMVIYRSFYEALNGLPEQNRLEVWAAICELGFNGVEVELIGLSKTIFMLIKPQIEANNRKAIAGKNNGYLGAEHGKKGGRPRSEKPPTKPTKNPQQNPQETPNKPTNVNVNANVNENDNVNANANFKKWGKDDLIKSMTPYAERYPKNMLNEFFNYWAEPLANGKLRLTAQDAWDTGRRLVTWSKRDKENKPQNAVVTRASMGVKMQ
jgi:hypothetical protein